MKQLLEQILLARVYEVAIETPLVRASKLSRRTNNNIYLKREDLQPVHSFKLRGAYNKIVQLSPQERKRGVIAASAGNHAQGVALAAHKLQIPATIIMPRTTPMIKIDAVKSYGATVILEGDSYSDAYEHAMTIVKQSEMIFIHPFDDPLVIAGQGTVGREIIEQLPDATHIFVPVGGGGLIAGIAAYVKQLRPDIKVVGVQPEDSNAMQASLAKNKRIILKHVGIFADGVAVKQVGTLTFELVKQYVDEVITVTTDQLCAGIKSVFEETRSIVEPAGALAAAGAEAYAVKQNLTDQNLVAICSGANITFEKLQFIAERTLLGSGQEALFAIKLAERPGSLQYFCENIVNGHSITEFSYRMHLRDEAYIFVGIHISDLQDETAFMQKMRAHAYEYIDLSADELAKEHIRHMIGGHSQNARNERLYQIYFPERPGALTDFLRTIDDDFNISLFHYRGQGGDVGRVLIGFELGKNGHELESRLKAIGYEFEAVESQAADLFLH
jgi:threonine dehydratase